MRALAFAAALPVAAATVREPRGGPPIRVRVGVHSGIAYSGVLGHMRPQFTFFGDSVNVASRMESTGLAGRVQVSAATRELVDEALLGAAADSQSAATREAPPGWLRSLGPAQWHPRRVQACRFRFPFSMSSDSKLLPYAHQNPHCSHNQAKGKGSMGTFLLRTLTSRGDSRQSAGGGVVQGEPSAEGGWGHILCPTFFEPHTTLVPLLAEGLICPPTGATLEHDELPLPEHVGPSVVPLSSLQLPGPTSVLDVCAF